MKTLALAVAATLVIAAVAAILLVVLPGRVKVAGDDNSAYPMEWSAGQLTYRTDVQTADCEMRITTEVLAPEGFEAENRVLIAPLADLDPERIETSAASPVMGLPGLITLNAHPGRAVRCELLAGGPCPTPERPKAELQLPPFWADRPDDFARLIRADIDQCSESQ